MKLNRILCAMLAALTVLPTAACAADPADTADTTASAATESTVPETTADPTALPAMDLEGWTFTAFVRGPAENSYWNCVDIYMEDFTGDALVDAVVDRNNKIEETYDCVIAQVESSKESLTEVRNLIAAGDTTYAAMCLRADYSAALAADLNLIDLHTMSYMQLGEAWWDQNAVAELSIGGKLYFTTGDLSISCNDALQIPAFNKTVLASHSEIGNPYDLVREGKWTIDQMTQMGLSVNADLNGDGSRTKADSWGYLAYPWGGLFLFFGSGETIVAKDEDDLPFLSVYTDRATEVMERIFDVHGGGNPDYLNGFSSVQTPMMSENRLLFTFVSLATLRKQFRQSVESDIGILPVPKFEEDQERYYNLVVFQDTANMYSVPKTCSDLKNTGFVLEALAQCSTDTLREAYYDKTISYKALRDRDSLEMLEIILATRTYDLASAYNWGGWNNFFTTTIPNSKGNNTFTSFYRQQETPTNTAIADTIAKFNSADA